MSHGCIIITLSHITAIKSEKTFSNTLAIVSHVPQQYVRARIKNSFYTIKKQGYIEPNDKPVDSNFSSL